MDQRWSLHSIEALQPIKKKQIKPTLGNPKKRSRPDELEVFEDSRDFFKQTSQIRVNKILSYKTAFQEAWMAFLNIDLSPRLFKLTLESIHDKIIPNFSTPHLLLSFLTASYNLSEDGLTKQTNRDEFFDQDISLLALRGIFTLMVDHNLYAPEPVSITI